MSTGAFLVVYFGGLYPEVLRGFLTVLGEPYRILRIELRSTTFKVNALPRYTIIFRPTLEFLVVVVFIQLKHHEGRDLTFDGLYNYPGVQPRLCISSTLKGFATCTSAVNAESRGRGIRLGIDWGLVVCWPEGRETRQFPLASQQHP